MIVLIQITGYLKHTVAYLLVLLYYSEDGKLKSRLVAKKVSKFSYLPKALTLCLSSQVNLQHYSAIQNMRAIEQLADYVHDVLIHSLFASNYYRQHNH